MASSRSVGMAGTSTEMNGFTFSYDFELPPTHSAYPFPSANHNGPRYRLNAIAILFEVSTTTRHLLDKEIVSAYQQDFIRKGAL